MLAQAFAQQLRNLLRIKTGFEFAGKRTMHKLCGFWVQFRPKPATVSRIPF